MLKKNFQQIFKDPGSFTISCTIGHLNFTNTLYDLGVNESLMPLLIARKFDLREMKGINITLQLTDRSIKCPIDIIENVIVKVKSFYILVNFIVFDTKEDKHLSIKLGRPFLVIIGALIEIKKSKLTFTMNDET